MYCTKLIISTNVFHLYTIDELTEMIKYTNLNFSGFLTNDMKITSVKMEPFYNVFMIYVEYTKDISIESIISSVEYIGFIKTLSGYFNCDMITQCSQC